MFYYKTFIVFSLIAAINLHSCNSQNGPDPWHAERVDDVQANIDELDLPPDLRISLKKKLNSENKLGAGGWFFKRTLAILLKGGLIRKNEHDETIDVSLQMKFDAKQWETLDDCVKSTTILSEDMFRRCIGFVEEAIYKPTITDKIAIAWSDYIQSFLIEYKVYITWSLALLALSASVIWLWKHMSHKHVFILVFILLYLYEAVVSYKEAEQKELERFMAAVSSCKWYFWASTCDVPPPDPLIFMKHMNPMKIGVRMFTTLVSEPMVMFSATVGIMLDGVTGGLWYPFDRILHGILTIFINISLVFIFILILFNFILNIPFNFSFLGLMSIGIKQRQRTLISDCSNSNTSSIRNSDRISEATLDKILNVCSLALTNTQSNTANQTAVITNAPAIKRSASTGRLSDLKHWSLESNNNLLALNVRKRNKRYDGSGDAF